MAWARTTGLEIAAEFGEQAHGEERSEYAQALLARRRVWALGSAKRRYERIKADPGRYRRYLATQNRCRARWLAKVKADPERAARWREQNRAWCAAYWARLKADPQKYEAQLARHREKKRQYINSLPAEKRKAYRRAYHEKIRAMLGDKRHKGRPRGVTRVLEPEVVAELRAGGQSAAQIALHFGVSPSSVYKALQKAGYSAKAVAAAPHPLDAARELLARLSSRRRP
jgi:hypothetical protein